MRIVPALFVATAYRSVRVHSLKMSSTAGCCPAGSLKFQKPADYAVMGTTKVLAGSSVEAYVPKDYVAGQPGCILVPDAFGWNSGRLRNVADYFAEKAGYYAVVPKMMQPAYEGAQDGDGFPNALTSTPDGMPKMGEFFATLPYDSVIKPQIGGVVAHMKAAGVTKICVVGFCWGGWVVSNVLADGDFPEVVAGASPHPSIQVEGWAHKTPNEALVARVKKPMQLLPAGNDNDMYRPGGLIWDTLIASSPESELVDTFKEVLPHGCLCLRCNPVAAHPVLLIL